MELSNGIIRLEFNEQTGALCKLCDLRTGKEHLADQTAGRLFQLLVPSASWESCHADARLQQCTFTKSGNTLTIRYAQLTAADGAVLPIRVDITVELPEGSREALLWMTIDNAGDRPVTEAWFPIIGEWSGYAGKGHDLFTPGTGMRSPFDPHVNPEPGSGATLLRMRLRRTFHFCLETMVPWMDLSGGGRGLWLINYMKQAWVGGFALERGHGYDVDAPLVFGWYSHPEVKPGKRWESAPFGIGLHRGDWHETARQYRTWLQSWWTPVDVPDRLRRMMGVQNIMFNGFDGQPIRPLAEMADTAKIGLKYGIQDLCVWDYPMLGIYGRLTSDRITDYSLENWETMRRGVAAVKALGVTVSTILNQRAVSSTCDFWRKGEGKHAALLMRDGTPKAESFPCGSFGAEMAPLWQGPQSVTMCCRSAEYHRELDYHLDRVMDVGFDALFIDQPYEDLPCYADNHGHETPDDTLQGLVDWLGVFRKRMRARYPQSYLIGEMPCAFTGQHIDFGWNWFWASSRPDIMAYTLPGPGLLNGYAIDGNIDYCQRAFLVGFLIMIVVNGLEGTLDDKPQFAEYIKRLAALREKTAHCTMFGQFEDTDGLQCEGATAKRFSYPGGDAVIVANMTDQPAQAQLCITGLQTARKAKLYRLDGSTKEMESLSEGRAGLELLLAPRDIVVWELAR